MSGRTRDFLIGTLFICLYFSDDKALNTCLSFIIKFKVFKAVKLYNLEMVVIYFILV